MSNCSKCGAELIDGGLNGECLICAQLSSTIKYKESKENETYNLGEYGGLSSMTNEDVSAHFSAIKHKNSAIWLHNKLDNHNGWTPKLVEEHLSDLLYLMDNHFDAMDDYNNKVLLLTKVSGYSRSQIIVTRGKVGIFKGIIGGKFNG